MNWLRRNWKWVIRWAAVLGIISDLLNLVGMLKIYTLTPRGVPELYESVPMSRLPECAFEEIYEEEAEPLFYLNLFEWLFGIGAIQDSAYDRAEQKIWRKVTAEGRPNDEMSGLKQIYKSFYFDHSGYHARLIMGRLRKEGTEEIFNPGCVVDLAGGDLRTRTTSAPFTCDSLTRVIQRNEARIQSAHTGRYCWSSFTYRIDYQAKQITFTERYFLTQDEGEFHE